MAFRPNTHSTGCEALIRPVGDDTRSNGSGGKQRSNFGQRSLKDDDAMFPDDAMEGKTEILLNRLSSRRSLKSESLTSRSLQSVLPADPAEQLVRKPATRRSLPDIADSTQFFFLQTPAMSASGVELNQSIV